MNAYGSLLFFMRPYRSLWDLTDPYASLCVFICLYMSFSAQMNLFESLKVLMRPYGF